jgi:hypothetical protein
MISLNEKRWVTSAFFVQMVNRRTVIYAIASKNVFWCNGCGLLPVLQ